jgi:GntR family transcriptional regulator
MPTDLAGSASSTIAEILAKLGTDPKTGLNPAELQERLNKYGANALAEEKKSALSVIVAYFWGPIPWMIEAAALMALIVKDWGDFHDHRLAPVVQRITWILGGTRSFQRAKIEATFGVLVLPILKVWSLRWSLDARTWNSISSRSAFRLAAHAPAGRLRESGRRRPFRSDRQRKQKKSLHVHLCYSSLYHYTYRMDREWNDSQPIYRQLRDRGVRMILDGVLKEGDPLPSVRNVAAEFRVNPLTVLKAYQQLVDEQLVEKKRGLGMFVKAGARNLLLKGERQKFLAEHWPRIAATIQRLGITPKELMRAAAPARRSKSKTGKEER